MQSILDNQGKYQVVGVVSDVECPALDRARQAAIPAELVELARGADPQVREEWNERLAEVVDRLQPDVVVSAGFMKILGAPFLSRFGGRTINTHPALLPAFPGDALAYGVKVTGSTVHFVDAGVDTGPIIAQEPVAIMPGESESDLHERIKQVERKLIVNVLNSATVAADNQGEVDFANHE